MFNKIFEMSAITGHLISLSANEHYLLYAYTSKMSLLLMNLSAKIVYLGIKLLLDVWNWGILVPHTVSFHETVKKLFAKCTVAQNKMHFVKLFNFTSLDMYNFM